jgi:hypothetical protein
MDTSPNVIDQVQIALATPIASLGRRRAVVAVPSTTRNGGSGHGGRVCRAGRRG